MKLEKVSNIFPNTGGVPTKYKKGLVTPGGTHKHAVHPPDPRRNALFTFANGKESIKMEWEHKTCEEERYKDSPYLYL